MGLVVDLFAGGGGASLGIELALGRSPDIAVNHDPEAVALHAANHPATRHLCGDVWDVKPRKIARRGEVDLLWASPDCTFHSKARGGKPFRDPESATGRRGLAWVVTRWAHDVAPRVICLENVEEFQDWGPLGEDGRPDKARAGLTFRRFVGTLRSAGYVVEWRELRACDFGAPTIRKRLFLVARCDGAPIVWPAPTHGRGLLPHRSAASCIDWSLACPSIFGRKKPLAEKTLARIARGIRRYVLEAADPFIVPAAHGGDHRVHSIREPLRTVTGAHRGDHALVSPTLVHIGNGEREGQAPRVYDIGKPLSTVVAEGQKHGLVAAFLAKHYGGGPTKATGQSLDESTHTVTCQGQLSLVTSNLVHFRGTSYERDARDPTPTITSGGIPLAEVRAFLTQYNGTSIGQGAQLPLNTIPTRDRFGVVTVHGEAFEIVDIGFRMLQPRELYRAQGFPDTYAIDVEHAGKPLTKEAQIRMCGNSVCPPVAAAIVRANVLDAREEVAAE